MLSRGFKDAFIVELQQKQHWVTRLQPDNLAGLYYR